MLDKIIEIFLTLVDMSGSVVGKKDSKSIILKIMGCVAWGIVLYGVIVLIKKA